MVKKLRRESGGSNEVFRCLCRESVARKWLLFNNIYSWRNPAAPSETACTDNLARAGYSVMLSDGSRFLVCSNSTSFLFLDTLAAAKCFGVLAVELKNCNGSVGGTVTGCILLRDIKSVSKPYGIHDRGFRPASELLQYADEHSAGRYGMLRFSARLLLLGEPDAPEYGACDVHKFASVAVNQGRIVL
jgi:hypothetical protein